MTVRLGISYAGSNRMRRFVIRVKENEGWRSSRKGKPRPARAGRRKGSLNKKTLSAAQARKPHRCGGSQSDRR